MPKGPGEQLEKGETANLFVYLCENRLYHLKPRRPVRKKNGFRTQKRRLEHGSGGCGVGGAMQGKEGRDTAEESTDNFAKGVGEKRS